MKKIIFLIVILSTFLSCHTGQERNGIITSIPIDTIIYNGKKVVIALNVMDTTHVTKNFEKLNYLEELRFCMEENFDNYRGYHYFKHLNSGIFIEIGDKGIEFIYKETHPDSYFSIYKIFDLNGFIKEKGLIITNTENERNIYTPPLSKIGTWYYYDKTGKLIQEVNYDEHYTFTFDDMINYCKKENIPVSKGIYFQTDTVFNDDGSIKWEEELITHIDKYEVNDPETFPSARGAKYLWTVNFRSNGGYKYGYKCTYITLNGQTGEVLSQSFGPRIIY